MAYQARLTVHRARRAGDAAAEHLPDTLMAKADPEDRHAAGILRDKPHRDSGFIWRAGAGRNDDGLGDLARQRRIVAYHFRHGTEFAEIIGDRVHEGIIIVDDENHFANSLAPKASKIARALSSVSSYSEAGSEAVVIPPPACTTQEPPRKPAVRITILVSIVPSNPI